MKTFCYLACFVIGLVVGCENHYVPPVEPSRFVDILPTKPVDKCEQLQADLATLEMRVANLEKACIDGKPEPPKFSAQDPPKNLTPRERVKCIIYSTEGCRPCAELKTEIKEQLCGKLGWTCGEGDECDFIFRDSNSWQTYPTIEFRIDDSPVLRISGKMPIADLSNRLKSLIENLDREA